MPMNQTNYISVFLFYSGQFHSDDHEETLPSKEWYSSKYNLFYNRQEVNSTS